MTRGFWAAVVAVVTLGACGDSTESFDDHPLEDVSERAENLTKGTSGAQNGDSDYCNSSANKCGLGEGDCDSSSQCQTGLSCVPGNLAKRGPLNGDACAPAHCGDGTRSGDETSADCGGSCGANCTVICDAPNGAAGKCSNDCPCSLGEGDCSSSAVCQAGLVCGANKGALFGLAAGVDVCWGGSACMNGVKDGAETAIDCGGSCAPCTPPTAGVVQVAAGGNALIPVVISPHADSAVHQKIVYTANELRDKLNAIVGGSGATPFLPVQVSSTPSGISVGIHGDFAGSGWPYEGYFRPANLAAGTNASPDRLALREQFVLRTPAGSNRVIVAGATVEGLRAGVWDLLDRIGYRHYFQTETWEIVPSSPSLSLNLAVDERPAFYSRNLFLNRGFVPWDSAAGVTINNEQHHWRKHNRLGTSGGPYSEPVTADRDPSLMYGGIMDWWATKHAVTFPAALTTAPTGTLHGRQLCLSASALVAGQTYTAIDVVREWAEHQTHAEPVLAVSPNRNVSWNSAASGGGLHCNDANDSTYGSVPNRVIALANAAAAVHPNKVINARVPRGSSSIAVRQNVLPIVEQTYANDAPFHFDNRVRHWGTAAQNVGVADNFWPRSSEVPDGLSVSTKEVVDRIRRLHVAGVRQYAADVGTGWGLPGPAVWALSRAAWDADTLTDQSADAYRNDFLERAFGSDGTTYGSAVPGARKFYDALESDPRWSENIIGVLYRALQEGFSANPRPVVETRLADLAKYVRYLELYRKFWNRCSAQSPATEQSEQLELLQFLYSMRDSHMVRSREMVSQLQGDVPNCPVAACAPGDSSCSPANVRCTPTGCVTSQNQQTTIACDVPEWGPECPSANATHGCGTCTTSACTNPVKTLATPTVAQMRAIVDAGVVNNAVLNVALLKNFSQDLVPYSPTAPATLTARMPSIYTIGAHSLFLQRSSTLGPLSVHIKKNGAANTIWGQLVAASTGAVIGNETFGPGTVETDWTFNTSSSVYRLNLDDADVRMWTSLPTSATGTRLAVPVGATDAPLAFNYRWSAYFLVPAGTPNVVGWSQADGQFTRHRKTGTNQWTTSTGFLSDYAVGKACTSPRIVIDTSPRDAFNDHFVIPVSPPATTDEVWYFNDGNSGAGGARLLMSVPPYLYRSPAEMLVPREVVSGVDCANGVSDGDEWSVDCGPSCPNKNCRAPLAPCNTDADCGAGTFCSGDALEALGITGGGNRVCWNEICRSGVNECGSLDKTCGRCLCRPTCENKQCGDNLFDGCNGFCEPVCSSGQSGCNSDAECPLDHLCVAGAGSSFGHAADAAVCVPARCLEPGTSSSDCGDPSDPCGTMCNPGYVACEGMACGNDPKTDVECGTCSGDLVCSLDHECVGPEEGVRVLSRTISYEVGATPGSHDVTALGRSTYRIPLRLPQGARGLTPNLELAFNDSAHLRGVLGPGWSLLGTSRVHRCIAPTKQDTLFIRSQQPLTSELCLDGRPLRFNEYLTGEEDNPDSTVFKLADDDGSKIVRSTSSATTFQVYKPDGTIYLYGARATERRSVRPFIPSTTFDIEDRTPTDSWHLSEIRDRFGNSARFHYTGERIGAEPFAVEKSFYLTHIDYSGHLRDGIRSAFRRRIKFSYRSKGDNLGATGGYFHFTPVDDNILLDSITVDTFGADGPHSADRIYRVGYEPTPGNEIQRVASVQECTGYELIPKCLPATTFQYDDGEIDDGANLPRRFEEPQTGAVEVQGSCLNCIFEGGSKPNQTLTLDVDGDGFKDLLQVNQEFPSLVFWHAEGNIDGSMTFASPIEIVGPSPGCVTGSSIADLDGDGRDEIIDSCPVARQKQQVSYFNIDEVGTVTEQVAGLKALTSPYVGDIDGNGRPDIIQETDTHIYFADFDHYDADDGTMRFTYNNRVDAVGIPSPKGAGGKVREPLMLDVDGDGTRNLMRFDPSTKQFFALRLAGEQELTDLERAHILLDSAQEPGGTAIFFNRIPRWTPTGLSYQVSPLTGGPAHFDSIRVLDINGDGLDDVWVQSATLLAPLDPNSFRVPDVTTGSEPNYGTEVARINRLIGQLHPGGVIDAGPSHLWINVGGAFKLKGAMLSKIYGEAPTPQQCVVRTTDGACVSRLYHDEFRRSLVMDYDNDGRDELLVQFWTDAGLEWHRIWLDEETPQRGYVAAERVLDLPADFDLYVADIDNNTNTQFNSLPVVADLNGDANLDMLVAGHRNRSGNRLLMLGSGQGAGRRLTKVTDGLGNTIEITHRRGRYAVYIDGACGDVHEGNRPRCLNTAPVVVRTVERGTVNGLDYGQRTYDYEQPTTADFMQGFYFRARNIDDRGALLSENRVRVAEIREEFYQALDNGQFTPKYTYPFLGAVNRREHKLPDEEDLLGDYRGRTIVEQYVFKNLVLPEGKPHLAEQTRTIIDEVAGGEEQVMREHQEFGTDNEGFIDTYDRTTFSGPDDDQIAWERVRSYRKYDRERWLLGSVETLEETAIRNGVQLTRSTTFDYDDETGFLKTKTQNAGDPDRQLITEYSPDKFGNTTETKETSVDGERVTTVLYATGGIYPKSVINAENHTKQFEYDDVWGRPTLLEDENGHVVVQLYDGFGRLIHKESQNGEDATVLEENTYDYVGEPYAVDDVAIASVFRKTTTSELVTGASIEEYDSRGLEVRTQKPDVSTDGSAPYLYTETAYNWAGKPVYRSEPHADEQVPAWTRMEYDWRGRPIWSTTTKGEKRFRYASLVQFADSFPEWTYPDALELLHISDEEGKEAIVIADHNDQMVVSADGVDLEEQGHGYASYTMRGALNLPISLVDPELNITSSEFNADGLLSWAEDTSRGETKFFYDAYGNLKLLVAADDVERKFTYDRINRITGRFDNDEDLSQWSYDVDANGEPKVGRLTETVGPTDIRTSFGYEDSPRALPTSTTRHVAGETFTTTMNFDRLGYPTRVLYPAVPQPDGDFEFAVRPMTDAHSGQIIAIQSDDESTDYWRIGATDRGRVTEVKLGNGVRETYDFHPVSQLLSSVQVLSDEGATLSSLAYTYYDNGQVARRLLTTGGATRSRSITYDDAKRVDVVTETGPDAFSEDFDFSPNGRLEWRSKFGEYSYDPDRPHTLVSVAGNTFRYDARGNQRSRTGSEISGEEQSIAYNLSNLPSQILLGDPGSPDRTVVFEYDANDSRVVKHETNGGPEVLSLGNEYERINGGDNSLGAEHKFRIFAAGREVAQVVYDEVTSLSTVQYLHRDLQMSVLFTSNDNGAISSVRDFDIFGEPVATPSWAATTTESYTGHRRDADIGLITAGARLYDAAFGVFISADPLRVGSASSQGFNPYAYANNDPFNLFDPTGLQAQDREPGIVITVYGCRGQPGWVCQGNLPPTNAPSGPWSSYPGELSRAELERIPSGYQVSSVQYPNLLTRPEFQITDSSQTWETALKVVTTSMNLLVAAEGIVGWIAVRTFLAKGSEVLAVSGGRGLVHMTGAGAEIAQSGLLLGRNGIYATSQATAGETGLALTVRTGLNPGSATSAVPIPTTALGAFAKPVPIGPLTAWQRLFGTQYTAAGTLNLATGTFARSGVNWNQVGIYAYDAGVTGSVVGGGVYAVWGD